MSEDFMYADLSRMLELPKCAVLIRTDEEARAFFHNSIQQIAEYTRWSLEDVLNFWNIYKEKTGFTLFIRYDEPESISYCNEAWFRNEGYETVEFSDLCNTVDIDESDQPIDTLFGGVK